MDYLPFRICIESNIGTGKKIFINILKKFLDERIEYLPNPLDNWQNNKLLFGFYQDTSRWAYLMETKSTIDKIKMYNSHSSESPIVIGERSWMSDKHVFCEVLFNDMNCITECEYDSYQSFYSTVSQSAPPINAIIYLRTTPDNSYDNILKRNRNEETNLNFSYIEKLQERMDNWLLPASNIECEEEKCCKVIVLEMEEDLEADEAKQRSLMNNLLDKLPMLSDYAKIQINLNDGWTKVKRKARSQDP
jgi:deoxyadenosine/deoxycytidine kinase